MSTTFHVDLDGAQVAPATRDAITSTASKTVTHEELLNEARVTAMHLLAELRQPGRSLHDDPGTSAALTSVTGLINVCAYGLP